jgi:hypothetical protein
LGSAAQRVFSDADAGQVCIYVPAVSDNYPLSPLLPETVIASHQYTTFRTSSIASSSPKQFLAVFLL